MQAIVLTDVSRFITYEVHNGSHAMNHDVQQNLVNAENRERWPILIWEHHMRQLRKGQGIMKPEDGRPQSAISENLSKLERVEAIESERLESSLGG